MDTIGITDALHKFDISIDDEGNTNIYGFRYIKPDGSMGEKICYKKHSNKMRGTKEYQSKNVGKNPNNLKRKGLLHVHDTLSDQIRTLKVAHLIEFQDNNSKKWARIIH